MDNQNKNEGAAKGAGNAITGVVDVVYLTDENACFYEKGDFIALKTSFKDEESGEIAENDRGIVTFRRLFPFESTEDMISVLSEHEEEIGIIRALSELKCADLIKKELDRTYFMPKISIIYSMKERFGYSNWSVMTDKGKLSFSINDIYKSLIRPGGGRIIINDIDGNRYEIEDVEKLDKKSYRFIELYL